MKLWQSSEYRSWRSMMDRVYGNDPKHADYARLTVCDEWRVSYLNFIRDMGMKPTPKHTIDRIDNEKGYFPENCRWATVTEQNRNKRNNTIPGTSLVQASEVYGLHPNSIRNRLRKGIALDAPKHSFRDNSTQQRGEDRENSKLTEDDVREIRKSAGSSILIADRYGVHSSLIRLVRAGKIWKHVKDLPL